MWVVRDYSHTLLRKSDEGNLIAKFREMSSFYEAIKAFDATKMLQKYNFLFLMTNQRIK